MEIEIQIENCGIKAFVLLIHVKKREKKKKVEMTWLIHPGCRNSRKACFTSLRRHARMGIVEAKKLIRTIAIIAISVRAASIAVTGTPAHTDKHTRVRNAQTLPSAGLNI